MEVRLRMARFDGASRRLFATKSAIGQVSWHWIITRCWQHMSVEDLGRKLSHCVLEFWDNIRAILLYFAVLFGIAIYQPGFIISHSSNGFKNILGLPLHSIYSKFLLSIQAYNSQFKARWFCWHQTLHAQNFLYPTQKIYIHHLHTSAASAYSLICYNPSSPSCCKYEHGC